MAAILVEGFTRQIKQGLHRDYVFQDQDIQTVRGKINPVDSMRHRINCRQLLNCHFDDLMTNNFSKTQRLKNSNHEKEILSKKQTLDRTFGIGKQ